MRCGEQQQKKNCNNEIRIINFANNGKSVYNNRQANKGGDKN